MFNVQELLALRAEDESSIIQCAACHTCKNLTLDCDAAVLLIMPLFIGLLSEITQYCSVSTVALLTVNKQRGHREGFSLQRACTISVKKLVYLKCVSKNYTFLFI